MDPNNLPLEPLMIPESVSAWPLAPIWWIGLFFLLLCLFALFILFKKINARARKMRLRKQIMALIEQQEKPYQSPAQDWLQQLNRDLKRMALHDYPERQQAFESGAQWLDFLVETAPKVDRNALQWLIQGQYQPNLYLENHQIDAIYHSVLIWIKNHV